jgi:cysteine-rich repeat protein
VFPYVTVKALYGIDTIIEVSNTSNLDITAYCFYTDDNPHCSTSGAICTNVGSACGPSAGTCLQLWHQTDFYLRLTRQQPLGWRAGRGLTEVAPASVSIPAVADSFRGTLHCVAADPNSTTVPIPVERNDLTGTATVERFVYSIPTSVLDVAKYAALGIPAALGTNNGDPVLLLGNTAEYAACPSAYTLNHLFDGATDPISGTDQVFTKLVLVPCSLRVGAPPPGPTQIQYIVFNEFEQRFLVSQSITGGQNIEPLSNISPSFNASIQGTLTGQTRFHSAAGSGGVLALALEEHHTVTVPLLVTTTAFNVHSSGTRQDTEALVIGPSLCGNGVVNAGEQCDDGNVVGGDCCSATCQFESAGTTCGGDICVGVATCNASGTCVPGIPLTCGPCETCAPDLGCTGSCPCQLDVDGSGPPPDVATDLVYIARALLGLAPVPASFRVLNPGIPSDAAIAAQVEALGGVLDVDGDGQVSVATDLVYIVRKLLGLPPVPPSFRTLDPAIPADAVIAAKILALCPILGPPTAAPTNTATVTPTPTSSSAGPQVVFFGVATSDGCVACDAPLCACGGTPTPVPTFDGQGRRIFEEVGSHFSIVVEGRPGSSGLPVGITLTPGGSATRPDLQIESTRALGNGSAAVCDAGLGGGVPGVAPLNFGPGQSITDALQDFACRFESFQPGAPCTKDRFGNSATVSPDATVQFCHVLAQTEALPVGDSILGVQLRDVGGNLGSVVEIVVRVTAPSQARLSFRQTGAVAT